MVERNENPQPVQFLFVGERRSPTAISEGYTWDNVPHQGALCAKKLFGALRETGIEPREHTFINAWDDDGNPQEITPEISDGKVVVAMGAKVQKELTDRGIPFTGIIHPAARGVWCRQEEYNAHVMQMLNIFITAAEEDPTDTSTAD